jgi:hypothetical protein
MIPEWCTVPSFRCPPIQTQHQRMPRIPVILIHHTPGHILR